MYCKNCKNLLPENEFICDRCHFDNFFEKGLSDDLIIKRTSPKKNNSSFFSVVVLFCILVIGIVFIYSIGETKAISDQISTTSTTTQHILVKERIFEFLFSDIKLSYSELFGNSTNTIFYKNNTDINITINTIAMENYNNIINSNDCLDSKIGEIPTKTYAGDLFYSHIFVLNNNYYEIKVNYVNDFNIYNEPLQKEISKILNSIVLNK